MWLAVCKTIIFFFHSSAWFLAWRHRVCTVSSSTTARTGSPDLNCLTRSRWVERLCLCTGILRLLHTFIWVYLLQAEVTEKNPEGYLSAAEIPLSRLYICMAGVFFTAAMVWVYTLMKHRYTCIRDPFLEFVVEIFAEFHFIRLLRLLKHPYTVCSQNWNVLICNLSYLLQTQTCRILSVYYIKHLVKNY